MAGSKVVDAPVYEGQIIVTQSGAYKLFSSVHARPVEAVREIIDNSSDEHLRRNSQDRISKQKGRGNIWVVLVREPDGSVTLTVTDDSRGMLPQFLPDDQEILAMWLEDERTGKVRPGDSLRHHLEGGEHSLSLRSLQWLMVLALSAKSVDLTSSDFNIIGQKGVGAHSVGVLTDGTVAWYSKPELSLARQYYGNSIRPEEIPTCYVSRPANSQIDAGNLTYQIRQALEPLTDPFGNQLACGTMVRIPHLRQEVLSALLPGKLPALFQQWYGENIRKEEYAIYVIDRWTKEGLGRSNGLIYEVPQADYHGIPLLQDHERNLDISGNNGRVTMDFRYNPNAKGYTPKLRRFNADVCPLTDLEELNVAPMNTGKVDGYVDYIKRPEREAPWNTDKSLPMPGPAREAFSRTLNHKIIPLLLARIQSIDEGSKQDKVLASSERVTLALNAAAQENVELQQLMGVKPDIAIADPPVGPRMSYPTKMMVAKIWDEHLQPVEGIVVHFALQGKRRDTKITGVNGRAHFGQVPVVGFPYSFEIELPPGIRALKTRFDFLSTPERPGIEYPIPVITGRPAPIKGKIKSFKVSYVPMDDPDRYFDTSWLLRDGTLQVNTAAEGVREMIESDIAEFDRMVANLAATALADVQGLEGDRRSQYQSKLAIQLIRLMYNTPKKATPTKVVRRKSTTTKKTRTSKDKLTT